MIKIVEIQEFSKVDYPGKLSAVFFSQGCHWNCSYCQYETLRPSHVVSTLSMADLKPFLEKRKNKLDAIVFSGGEPLLQFGLPEAMSFVREMGYLVGLHTAGSMPKRLEKCLPFLDWVGLDVKHLPEYYEELIGVPIDPERVFESIELLKKSGVEFECRTTVHPKWHKDSEVVKLARNLKELGVENYSLQRYQDFECRDDETKEESEKDWVGSRLKEKIEPLFEILTLRH